MNASKELGVDALADIDIQDIEKIKKLENPVFKRAKHVIEEINRVKIVI